MTTQTGFITIDNYDIQELVEYIITLESTHTVFGHPTIVHICSIELFLDRRTNERLIIALLDMYRNLKKDTIILDNINPIYYLGRTLSYGCYIKEIAQSENKVMFNIGSDFYDQTEIPLLFKRRIKLDKIKQKIKTLKSA